MSSYTFDLEIESWELRVEVTVIGGYTPSSMSGPEEWPEPEWYVSKVLSIGSFDDIDDDSIMYAVCDELDDLYDRGPDL